MNPEDLFENPNLPIDTGDLKQEEIIDISSIEDDAKSIATKLVNKVKKMYFTNSELKADGYASTIIERAIDSITLLEKMIISNNQLQDKLIINCCLNSGNNGLFMSLTRIQDCIMDIQARITKELQELHEDLNEIKNSDVEDDEDEPKVVESKTAFRGGKDFLKSMIENNEES